MKNKKKLFVDADCLSCFLYTNKGSLLQRLFPEHDILIPHAVSSEIERNRKYIKTSNKKKTIIDNYDFAKKNNYFQIMNDFESDSDEFYMVMQLNGKGYDGGRSIGLGEAQVIAAAYYNEGQIASNNLNDVSEYTSKLKIKNWTASDILYKAYKEGVEDETTIESLWSKLISVEFKMPTDTFKKFKERKERKHA